MILEVILVFVLQLGVKLVVTMLPMSKLPAIIRRFRQCLFGLVLASGAVPAMAVELLMVEQAICPFCKQFDAEVDYSNTKTGQAIPLRRIQLTDPWPQDLASISHDMLTPTFILVDNGKELGRLRGYPGKEPFWALINQLIKEQKIDIN